MPLTANDQQMSTHQWPGIPSPDFPGHREVVYSEGQLSGYRWYDAHNATPAFPFGFGLTYGVFAYSDLSVADRAVTFTATGSGGCDTPQLYVSFPDAGSDRGSGPATPSKVLRYFQKTCQPQAVITYTLTDRDLSTWDVQRKEWVLARGTFGIHVAGSAQEMAGAVRGPVALRGTMLV